MRHVILFGSLIVQMALSAQAQSAVSLVDSMLVVQESDSLVTITFRVVDPLPTSFFQFARSGSSTAGAADYLDITSEIVAADDTLVVYQVIIIDDSLVEGTETVSWTIRKFEGGGVDTVRVMEPTQFVLSIVDNDTSQNTHAGILTANDISIFPNPTHDIVYVNHVKRGASMSVYNALGHQINPLSGWANGRQWVDFTAYPGGMYVLAIRQDESWQYRTLWVDR